MRTALDSSVLILLYRKQAGWERWRDQLQSAAAAGELIISPVAFAEYSIAYVPDNDDFFAGTHVQFQAKRWRHAVGSVEINSFRGALSATAILTLYFELSGFACLWMAAFGMAAQNTERVQSKTEVTGTQKLRAINKETGK